MITAVNIAALMAISKRAKQTKSKSVYSFDSALIGLGVASGHKNGKKK